MGQSEYFPQGIGRVKSTENRSRENPDLAFPVGLIAISVPWCARGSLKKKGKGKKGNKWLIERGATVASCQRACLEEESCKFATLQKKGKSSKWKCASFTKCRKIKKSNKFMTFAKAKVTSAKADELGEIWTE